MKQIQTGDEIEDLARDFTVMARRVLSYHELLKQEIASKTAELQRDLDLAREFQEALMPHAYPQVPGANVSDPLTIRFHHLYKPTSSVGGDFFDVVKLSDHRAGVFIADVMGHGTRSALVTAMLRTLLQDLAQQADDPANFLTLMNRQFHEIIAESNQFIFASAFYLIVDTEQAQASYASAGHPSPFQADRNTKEVSLLIQGLKGNPALGLYSDSVYTGYTRPIKDGDLFLLYTDGVPEALNEQGEEFSRERLQQIIEQSLDHDADKLTRSILDAVNTFLNSAPLPDDVCLVTVEVDAAKPPARAKATKSARA
jgi:serine phosphatase RsbU (regulator of sigma subunit)